MDNSRQLQSHLLEGNSRLHRWASPQSLSSNWWIKIASMAHKKSWLFYLGAILTEWKLIKAWRTHVKNNQTKACFKGTSQQWVQEISLISVSYFQFIMTEGKLWHHFLRRETQNPVAEAVCSSLGKSENSHLVWGSTGYRSICQRKYLNTSYLSWFNQLSFNMTFCTRQDGQITCLHNL